MGLEVGGLQGARRRRRPASEGRAVQGVQRPRGGLCRGGVGCPARGPRFSPRPPCPELPAGLRPAAPLAHALLPRRPARSPPLRPASAPSLAAAERRTRHAALGSWRAGGRAVPERRGRRPARGKGEGRGRRERGEGGPESASSQPVCRDRQVSARRRDESVLSGS